MNLELKPISVWNAQVFLKDKNVVLKKPIDESDLPDLIKLEDLKFPASFDFAISVVDESQKTHGVIAMVANGEKCALAHLYTDGTALVGSLLYGAAWRAAKALGYKQITI